MAKKKTKNRSSNFRKALGLMTEQRFKINEMLKEISQTFFRSQIINRHALENLRIGLEKTEETIDCLSAVLIELQS